MWGVNPTSGTREPSPLGPRYDVEKLDAVCISVKAGRPAAHRPAAGAPRAAQASGRPR